MKRSSLLLTLTIVSIMTFSRLIALNMDRHADQGSGAVADDAGVYSAALKGLYPEHRYFVMLDRTISDGETAGPSFAHWVEPTLRSGSVENRLWGALRLKARRAYPLHRTAFAREFVLVSELALQRAGRSKFARVYPEAGGIVLVSPVVYNQDGTRAYFELAWGLSSCSERLPVHMAKVMNAWQVLPTGQPAACSPNRP
jgi:hypothetical protein